MPDYEADHIVIGLDIKAYSLRDLPRQKAAQEVMDDCLQAGFSKSDDRHVKEAKWIDGGDGGYVLLEGSAQNALEAMVRFYERLAWKNKQLRENEKVYVRSAIHIDKLHCWSSQHFGNRYTGNAINNCSRLLNGMNKTLTGQVVCSGEFFGKLNTMKKDVEYERLRDITDKHGNAHKVYNIYRSPGFGVSAAKKDRYPDPLEW
jgi:hypothetical protein